VSKASGLNERCGFGQRRYN